MKLERRHVPIPIALTVLVLSCGGDDAAGPTDPGDENEDVPAENQAPSASISSPADDASFEEGESIAFEGSATDAEDGALTGGALEWDSDVDGTLGSGTSLTRDDLSAGTHTITLTATDSDGATATDQVRIEVTAAPPPDLMPLEEGRQWRYTEDSESTVCASSTGCSTTTFVGRRFVRVEQEVFYEGRTSWRLRTYSVRDDAQASDYAFETSVTYISQDDTGLHQWVPGPGVWRRVLSHSSPTIFDGTFFLIDGPPHDPDRRLTVGTSSTTVPFGSFSTIRVAHEYRETGEYATEDIFDAASEHYAPDVGMVAGSWDYHYDDNDPGGTDLFTEGTIELTHMDTGPFPERVPEGEPNDDHTAATVLSGFSIGEGDILLGDDAVIIDDEDVGCTLDECVHPDATGQKRIQDWFRLDVNAETEIRIALDFLKYDDEAGTFNDLDLYLFAADGSGGLLYLARADGPEGEREQLVGTIRPGTYFVGIQAWSTPAGRVPFWLAIL